MNTEMAKRNFLKTVKADGEVIEFLRLEANLVVAKYTENRSGRKSVSN